MLIMPALNGINLNGQFQKILIQQIPGTSQYYVFYSVNNKDDPQDNSSFTLKYAIVDMSLQGGKGDVTVYDQVIESKSSPSFAIIEGQQPDESWLVVHKCATDSFFSYKINNTGISNIAIISKAGTNKLTIDYVFRDLKASFNGKLIAGIAYRDYTIAFAYTWWLVEVFDFNGTTGLLTSKIRTPRTSGYFFSNFSLEFSPDSRLLYSTMVTRAPGLQPCGFASGTITQYNFCYTDTNDFRMYSHRIASDFRFCGPYASWGKMLLGADKKMHIPYSGYLVSQIKNPNRIGSSCNYEFNAYSVAVTNNSEVGTPQFNPIVMKRAVQNNIIYDGGCYPEPIRFQVTNQNISNLSWNFGDPSSSDNTSSQQDPSHIFSNPGTYTVTASFLDNLTGKSDFIQEIIEIKNPAIRLLSNYPQDTVICGTPNISLTLRLQAINGIFHWYQRNAAGQRYNDSVADTVNIASTGTWYVEMKQNGCNNCTLLDSIKVTIVTQSGNLGSSRTLCTGDSLTLSIPPDPEAIYTWSTGEHTNAINIKSPGLYKLLVEFPKYGCSFRDSSNVTAAQGVVFHLPNDTTICNGESLLLNPGVSNAVFKWQDGTTQPSYLVKQPGQYWVSIMNFMGCQSADTIHVSYSTAIKPDLGKDTAACMGNILILQPANITGNAIWNTGATTNFISVTQPGNYWIQVNNGSCSIRDTITVNFNQPPALSLGPDTILCNKDQLFLDPKFSNSIYTWNDGSFSPTFTIRQPGQYWLRLEKDNCVVNDTILVQYSTSPQINLGADLRFCTGDSVVLDAGPGFSSYLWNTGINNRMITVSGPGNFIISATTSDKCSSRDTINILNPYPLPIVNLGNSGPICVSGSKELDAGAGYILYTWNTGSTSRQITVNQPGKFSVRVTDMNGCLSGDTIDISALVPLPANFLPADTSICKYGTLQLSPKTSFRQYTWSNLQTSQSTVIARPGTYWLRVTDNNNCTGTDSIVVTPVDCQIGLFVPNAFTPGNDGKNDRFVPIISGSVQSYLFTIYNRFGEIVFQSTDPLQSWDGRFRGSEQPSGVFAWILRYQLNGETSKSEKGTVMLIR